MSDGAQNLLDGTIDFSLKWATSKNILLFSVSAKRVSLWSMIMCDTIIVPNWQFPVTCTFSVSLNFEAYQITGQWGEFRVKNAALCLHILFLAFVVVVVFLQTTCIFIIIIYIFDKVSNFRNRILTNQKSQLVITNWRWNCMNSWSRSSNFC